MRLIVHYSWPGNIRELRTVRFGIQVATHVGEPAPHDLQIEETRVTTDPHGVRHLELNLVNTGEVGYRPSVSVEIYNEAGSLVSGLEDQRGLLVLQPAAGAPSAELANREAVADPEAVPAGIILRIPPRGPLTREERQAHWEYLMRPGR